MNNSIKKYTKKNGTTAYMFKKYLGVDPLTGKQKETTRRGFKTIKEAKIALSRLEVEIQENGIQSKPKKRKYKEVCDEWFDEVYKHRVKESTFWNIKLIFEKHILPKLGNLFIQNISTNHCQKFANEWAIESNKRYDRYINYAGMIFKYAISIDQLKTNPMEKINIPVTKNSNSSFRKYYERDELIDFLDRMENQFPIVRYTFFSLLAYTGLRKGEALALQWADINLVGKKITINKTLASGKHGELLIQTPKTKASNRTISVDQHTVDLLKNWRTAQCQELKLLDIPIEPTQLIFTKFDNHLMYPRTPLSWLDSFYIKNPDMFRISPHGFRHTHASLLFAGGATMKQAQSRLGHSTIKTTMNVYTHVTKEDEEETADIFAAFMEQGKSLGQNLGQKKSLLK